MVRKRFEYQRMTAQELRDDLDAIAMPINAFARITGSLAERVQKWARGEEDIPTWVPVFTSVLRNVPGAVVEARQAAAERIVRDLKDPSGKEFPYLEEEAPDDD